MAGVQEFIKIVKAEFPDDRLTYQKAIPTFHPESSQEAAAFIKLAAKHGQRVFITGFGNNVDPTGDRFRELVTIKTDRLNQLHEVSSPGLCVKVGAGFPLLEVNHELAPHGLFVPHSGLPYVGSVGGAVAVNLSAELHTVRLPLGRFVLQVEVVTGAGEILNAGSPRMKTVGGRDIAGIFAGSWGLLGLIVTVTLRAVPASAADDYAALKMHEVSRRGFVATGGSGAASSDQEYFRKIKSRFDPDGIFPTL